MKWLAIHSSEFLAFKIWISNWLYSRLRLTTYAHWLQQKTHSLLERFTHKQKGREDKFIGRCLLHLIRWNIVYGSRMLNKGVTIVCLSGAFVGHTLRETFPHKMFFNMLPSDDVIYSATIPIHATLVMIMYWVLLTRPAWHSWRNYCVP